jgi:hypothetical protein
MALEKDMVPKIALEKGPSAKKCASKVISAPGIAPRLARGLNWCRSFWALRQISNGHKIHAHPLSAGLFAFYSYTRQTGVRA